jgi:activator of HSP90 ATPase
MARMPLETVRLTAVLPASSDRIYAAWLDSTEHSRMTGGKAVVDPSVGGEHSAWDGYIEGKTLELEPGRRIVQSWRSSDFPLGAGDSRLEVHLLDVADGCEVTIIHTEIPEGQGAQYESGWRDHYLEPMRKYFGKPKPKPKAKPKPKKAAKPKKKAAPKKSKRPVKRKAALPKAKRRRR